MGFVAVAVLGWTVVAARRATDARPSVVPALIGLLLAVSAVPVIQAGAELIVTRTSTGDFVDRLTGTDVSLLEVQALALRLPMPAPDETDGAPAWYYAVRDDLSDDRVALIRSPISPVALETRSMVARVVDEAPALAGVDAALRRHGWLPAGGTNPEPGTAAGRYLEEVSRPDGPVADVSTLAGLHGRSAGDLVRITLRFEGRGIAACEAADPAAQLGAGCDASRLATGTGGFYQLASDANDATVVVRTSYPATAMPIHAVGRQVRAEEELASVLAVPWIHRLVGWADVLPFAYLDQDPHLPVDRWWGAPTLFVLLALLLLVGRRIAYPVLVLEERRELEASATSGASQAPAIVTLAVSGRLARERGGPLDVTEAPAELRPAPDADGRATLLVRAAGGPLEMLLPASAGALTNLDRGRVHWLRRTRPALWLHWFGSDARLVFADEPARDAAERILAGLRAPEAGQRRRRGASMQR